jgi:hypothetical protein
MKLEARRDCRPTGLPAGLLCQYCVLQLPIISVTSFTSLLPLQFFHMRHNCTSQPARPSSKLLASSKYKQYSLYRSEVLTVVVVESSVLWDITPCSPLKSNRSFGETYRLHIQSRRISQKKTPENLLPASYRCLAWLILRT